MRRCRGAAREVSDSGSPSAPACCCLSANRNVDLCPGQLLERALGLPCWDNPGAGASPEEKLMKCLTPDQLHLAHPPVPGEGWSLELRRDLHTFLPPFPAALTQPCASSLWFLSFLSRSMKGYFPHPANSVLLEILLPFLATCPLWTD